MGCGASSEQAVAVTPAEAPAENKASGNNEKVIELLGASENGDVDALKKLIEEKADVNGKDEFGSTALSAAKSNDVVAVLLAAKADPTYKAQDGSSVLHYYAAGSAAFASQVEAMIATIVAAGADVNAKDQFGRTPLMKASSVEAVKALVAAKADAGLKDEDGVTAADHASDPAVAAAIKAL